MPELIKHVFPGHGEFYFCDCRELLATLPDKSIDLLLTDPPYGSRNATSGVVRTGGTWAAKYGTKIHQWDSPPL